MKTPQRKDGTTYSILVLPPRNRLMEKKNTKRYRISPLSVGLYIKYIQRHKVKNNTCLLVTSVILCQVMRVRTGFCFMDFSRGDRSSRHVALCPMRRRLPTPRSGRRPKPRHPTLNSELQSIVRFRTAPGYRHFVRHYNDRREQTTR